MRVAHVGDYKPGTANGVDQTIAGLAAALPDAGCETELWHPTIHVSAVSRRVVDNVTIFDLPVVRTLIPRLAKESVHFLRRRASAVDLLHLHSVFRWDNLAVARATQLPYVLTPNGGYSLSVLRGRRHLQKKIWWVLFERRLIRRAAGLQAVSPPELGQLAALGLNPLVTFVPNGVSNRLLDVPVPQPSASRVALFLGRLAVQQKGLDLLVEAFAEFRKRRESPDAQLVIAGPDFRGGAAETAALISQWHLEGCVSLTGAVFDDAKRRMLGSARVFAHVSRWEGMPFSILEAMGLGRPVLISHGTNLAEVVAAAGAGYVVEDGATGEIAAALYEAFTDDNAVNVKGAAARRLVEREYTWQRIAGRLVDFYREALKSRRGEP